MGIPKVVRQDIYIKAPLKPVYPTQLHCKVHHHVDALLINTDHPTFVHQQGGSNAVAPNRHQAISNHHADFIVTNVI